MPARGRLLPWISLLVVWTVWGSTYLAIRVVVREMPPFAAASIRFVAAGAVMAVLAFVLNRRDGFPTRRQWIDYSVIGILLLGVGNALVMWSEKTIPSGIAALIVATVPVWIVLLDGLRPGGQPWSARVWAGTVVGLVGVALVARPEGGLTSGHWKGILALQVAAFSWTIGSLYSKSLSERLPVLTAAAVEMLAGGAFLFVESRLVGEDFGRIASASNAAWGALAYLLVFGSLVGFTAFAYCLDELPARTVGTYAYVNPVVAVALGALILHEPLSAGLLVGGLLILASVLVSTMSATARAAAPAPSSSNEEAAA
jgi:drug/metabolite transporter (DMT)-like permease